MKLLTLCLAAALIFVVNTTVYAAEPVSFHNGLSLQGFTGVLNIPSARVTDEGWLYGLYSNQEESSWRTKIPFQHNTMFSFGLFSFIELGGRFFEAPGVGRDLSGNVKITTAPLSRNYPLLPVAALGVQDVGGGATFLRSRYLAISEDIWRMRLTAGYGFGPDRMKGAFAGGEFKVHDLLYLLADYDTRETNIGARVVTPQFWKVPVQFTTTVKTSLNHKPGDFEVAAGFSLPLDFTVRKNVSPKSDRSASVSPAPPSPAAHTTEPVHAVPQAAKTESPASASSHESRNAANRGAITDPLLLLRTRLAEEGFLNIRVGARARTLTVEYENTMFNHNELDALGLVAGLACQSAPDDIETVRVTVKHRNIPVVNITARLHDLKRFLESSSNSSASSTFLKIDFENPNDGDGGSLTNESLFFTSLSIGPGLTTFIGTEVGAFDYLLSVKPELTTLLWKGAAATARWDVPVAWSENLENGRLYRSSRSPAQIDRLMLFQAFKPFPSVMVQAGAGMILHDRYGVLNEAGWSPGLGKHRFRIAQGWNRNQADSKESSLALGSYRYYHAPLDMSLEAAAGRFWSEDTGFSIELKRFWRDAAFSAMYKNSTGSDHKRWQSVGVQISFPLTPRRDMKPVAGFQVRGNDEWSYAQNSTLKNRNMGAGNVNWIPTYPLAVNPQPAQALYRSFYNRDRLSAAYIRQHADRLREAWQIYRNSGQ